MSQRDPRADELLCDEALEGLSPDELSALEAMLGDQLEAERDRVGRAAAAVDLAYTRPAPLPASLRQRILEDARPFVRDEAAPAPPADPLASAPPASASQASGSSAGEGAQVIPLRRPWAPWLVAVACAAAAVIAVATRPAPPPREVVTLTVSVPVPVPPPPAPRPSEERARLLAAGAIRTAWTNTKDPASGGVEGDVVWSNSEQRGYMTFRGLAVNDPKALQYQLWIFDKNQDKRYPIDGGVFDINAAGEVVVPIVAKLQVQEPTLFAITIEKPGGVVVSSRQRLVLAAPVPAG